VGVTLGLSYRKCQLDWAGRTEGWREEILLLLLPLLLLLLKSSHESAVQFVV
jgi:hypothetical protein